MSELRDILTYEFSRYFGTRKRCIQAWLVHSPQYTIYRFQRYLRKEEYYGKSHSIVGKILFAYFKRRKNVLGEKCGFDIPANVFLPGLKILHISPVTVNGKARVGKDCTITGNICLGGDARGGVPQIGDNCTLGYGSSVIGAVEIADGCRIGAGAVVLKGCSEKGIDLVGIPARPLVHQEESKNDRFKTKAI